MADIEGTETGESLYGTDGTDTINGHGGDDRLTGGAGADTINGGEGNDRLYSYTRLLGPNEVFDPGWYPKEPTDTFLDIDTLSGGGGDDEFYAGYGDFVDGGAGTDTLYVNFLGATACVTADFRQLALGPVVIGGGTIADVEIVGNIIGSNFGDVLASYHAP